MYFPTAGVETSFFIPPLASFIVSFFMSMLGLSGAFLLIPFQISFLGYTNPSVSSTTQLYNVISNPVGALQYAREHRMIWPLAWIIIFGGIPGVMVGALIRITYLSDSQSFKIFVATVLLIIGAKLTQSLLSSFFPKKSIHPLINIKSSSTKVIQKSLRQISYTYANNSYTFSVIKTFLLSLLVGIIGGIYGIGGSAIIVPFLTSIFGLPIHTIAGAALMGSGVISVISVLFYSFLALLYPNISVAPDLLLALLFGIGGIIGMYLGAYCQKFIPGIWLKLFMILVIFGVAVKYTLDYFQ
ncbi:hypothetical protein BW722_04925 [Lawsonia intracellularis]|uniref:sulfite exporter TauE/SafE family protein n=1 Tax=Lawsonia intracellularis TaxID=29546 RepID=UPI00097878A8|nr:sulfite exporter TauE/SafE family protein [Lawsonia intracellularis]OMQ02806.1 hypothetical protein BW722_04925 [Lawsonia intracellularis]